MLSRLVVSAVNLSLTSRNKSLHYLISLKKEVRLEENGDEITVEKYKSFLFFSIPDTGTGTAIIILSGSGEDEIYRMFFF